MLRLLLVFAPAVLFGQGAVTGRVVDALTGAPLSGAKVILSQQGKRNQDWRTTSGRNGEFSVPDILAGDGYYLQATKRTYLPGGKPQYFNQAPLRVGASGLTGVTLPLMPQAVLAGTLVDAFGQPAEGEFLKVRRIPFSEHVMKGLNTESIAMTDDLGRFRLAGLKPGEYQIVRSYDEVLAQCRVGPGHVLDTLRITIPHPLRYSVRVRLAETTSIPPRLTASLEPGSHLGDVQADGSILFARVPPGNYTATAASPTYFASASVSVRDTDVTGIELRPIPSSILRGRVRVDGPRRVPVEGIRIAVLTPFSDFISFDATVAADGAFSIPGFPAGAADFRIAAPAGAYIRDIRTRKGLTEMVFSTATAALEGTVEPPSDGQRFGAGIVYLVPEGKWLGALRNPERYQSFVTAELTFSMRDLAPGRYVAIAAETLLSEGVSAERLRALKAFAKVVTLSAGPPRKVVLPHTRAEHLVAGSIDIAR